MSRIGKMPIEIPSGVEVKLQDGQIIVKGPKGSLLKKLVPEIRIDIKDGKITLTRQNNENRVKSFHGLYRTLIANMVKGVTKGFEKRLVLSGVGYRGQKEGKKLVLQLGFSHAVVIDPPAGVDINIEKAEIIVVGADKEQVGQVAADIRASRPVEPYKAKGIKYFDEIVIRKAGKAAKAAAGAGAAK